MASTMERHADLAGPGIGSYEELEQLLPRDYAPLLDPKETQRAIHELKAFIEDGLCRELNLLPVTVPLLVDAESGLNDFLDKDGSRQPIEFRIDNDHGKNPITAQVVQAATKWKRYALNQFGFEVGEGLITDMRAVRKDYFLDHDHSSYVDQWDWEQVISERDRNLHYLTDSVERIWRVLTGAENFILDRYPVLQTTKYQKLPERLTFIHSEDLLAHYPRLSRQERETEIAKECGAVFIYGIGWTLSNGFPHEMRAPDADDWVTETKSEDGRTMHGLNGHIIAWNSVTKRRHELSSMGIRVNRETLQRQLELTDRIDLLHYPYHQAVVRGTLPLSIGGGIGQSRTFMLLLRKAHLGEVSVSVWPKALKDMCAERRIHVLE
ncbi:MAG: aspartate--ammonia ligase [Candidatus Eisenbacteria bacterium]|nr:aspartate--ammonia ligase [Candidatus Eisenbacteria bacterium]